MEVCTSGSVLVALPVCSTCAGWPSAEWWPRNRWRPWRFPCPSVTTWPTESSNPAPQHQLTHLLQRNAGKPTNPSFSDEINSFNWTLLNKQTRPGQDAPHPGLRPPPHPLTAGCCFVHIYFCKCFGILVCLGSGHRVYLSGQVLCFIWGIVPSMSSVWYLQVFSSVSPPVSFNPSPSLPTWICCCT